MAHGGLGRLEEVNPEKKRAVGRRCCEVVGHLSLAQRRVRKFYFRVLETEMHLSKPQEPVRIDEEDRRRVKPRPSPSLKAHVFRPGLRILPPSQRYAPK